MYPLYLLYVQNALSPLFICKIMHNLFSDLKITQ